MSKTVKNLLLVFILLCLIILVVFVIELFVVNRDVEPVTDLTSVDTSPPVSTGSPSPPPASNTPDSPASADASDSTAPSGEVSPPIQSADGELYEMPLPGGLTLSLIADEEQFEHEMLDMLGNMFIYKSPMGEPATLELSIIEGQEAIVIAPGFLENYIDYVSGGSFISGGDCYVAGSKLYGELVIASKDGETYEAWLVDLEGAVLAIVLNYWTDAQKSALYNVLDTLEMTAS